MKIKRAETYISGGVADPRSGSLGSTNGLGSPKGKRTEAHTAPTKYGMGDYYGTGQKNPIGRVRDATVGFRPVNRKQMAKPPKSLA